MKLFYVLGLLSLYIALISAQNTPDSTASTDSSPVTEGSTAGPTDAPPVTTPASADQTTSAQGDTTTAPVAGDLYYYQGDSAICILMKVTMQFNISYEKSDNTTGLTYIDLPDNSTVQVTGDCGNDQFINLTWTPKQGSNNVASVRMDFAKENDEQYVSLITLKYVLSPDLFPDATNPDTEQEAKLNATMFKVSSGNQYLCRANSSFNLEPNVQMMTEQFNLQAYRTTNSTDFTGESQQCPADAETSNIVPIAVGAALAALVVIVLIAYLISRNRNKGGYESV